MLSIHSCWFFEINYCLLINQNYKMDFTDPTSVPIL